MDEIVTRTRRLADDLTRRVEAVPADAWDGPAPCEGWTARDVVGHLVEWMPAFFLQGWDVEVPPIPSVADDPVAAWSTVRDALLAALEDPAVGDTPRDSPMGPVTMGEAFAIAGTSDLLIHTWDLARATGGDEVLDPDEVHRLAEGLEDVDDGPMRASGHFGPWVEVADDADEQTLVLAFMGRRP